MMVVVSGSLTVVVGCLVVVVFSTLVVVGALVVVVVVGLGLGLGRDVLTLLRGFLVVMTSEKDLKGSKEGALLLNVLGLDSL